MSTRIAFVAATIATVGIIATVLMFVYQRGVETNSIRGEFLGVALAMVAQCQHGVDDVMKGT